MRAPVGLEDAAPMEEVMNQTVDDNHRPADLHPLASVPSPSDQDPGQAHGDELGANPEDRPIQMSRRKTSRDDSLPLFGLGVILIIVLVAVFNHS